MSQTTLEVKEEIVRLYNEQNKTSLTDEDIEFRVDGEFTSVRDLTRKDSLKVLESLLPDEK